jgi:hypothetical protein
MIYPDDDRDGHRNVGIQRTPNAANSPRRLYQHLSIAKFWEKMEDMFLFSHYTGLINLQVDTDRKAKVTYLLLQLENSPECNFQVNSL